MLSAGYFCFFLMGGSLGFLGAGGAILAIPILVYIFKIDFLLATTYSLFLVGSTTLAGVFLNYKNVDFRKGIFFALPSFITIYCMRTFVIHKIPLTVYGFSRDSILTLLLTFFMLCAAYFMISTKKIDTNPTSKGSPVSAISYALSSLGGLGIGFMAGLLGTGGGFFILPTLTLVLRMEMHEAIATSLFIIATNSLVGFLSDFHQVENIDIFGLLGFLACALTGMFAGSNLGKHVSSHNLKIIFGYFVATLAIAMIVKEFMK